MITELDAKMVGISKETLDKMAAAGVTSLQALSGQKAKTLSELSGVGEDTLEKAINKAIKLTSMGFITGEQLQQQRSERTHLHTGSYALDAIISKVGGIESQTTTEIIGAGAIGKTQIAHTLMVLAQQPIENKGLGGDVAIIDSEDTFRPDRIKEIAEARGFDPVATLTGIHWALAKNSDHQKLLINQLYELIPLHNIKLVIVDSMMGNLRSEYIGRGTLSNRQGELADMLKTLLNVALNMKVTVVYTNQVVSDPSIMFGNADKPAGGNIMGHAAGTRLQLRRGREGVRIAKLIDSLSMQEAEAPFIISEKGIEDVPVKKKEEK
jgi:DNA repair protein RadA